MYALETDGTYIYVGGSFANVNVGNDISANNVARWNPNLLSWSNLPGSSNLGVSNGVDGSVNALSYSSSQGKLFVGGDFQTVDSFGVPASNVAYWDLGTKWFALAGGSGEGTSGRVNAIKTSGDYVYVGGEFLSVNVAADISANYIAVWHSSSTWYSVIGFDDEVFSLCIINNFLLAGSVQLVSNTIDKWLIV